MTSWTIDASWDVRYFIAMGFYLFSYSLVIEQILFLTHFSLPKWIGKFYMAFPPDLFYFVHYFSLVTVAYDKHINFS